MIVLVYLKTMHHLPDCIKCHKKTIINDEIKSVKTLKGNSQLTLKRVKNSLSPKKNSTSCNCCIQKYILNTNSNPAQNTANMTNSDEN